MLGGFAKTLFGSSNDRHVKSLNPITNKIASFEPTLQALSDADLAAQTVKFREQLAAGTKLDDLLPEAFATVREAAKRVLGQRHYDVQMVGGIVLHRGEIAEMRTGEGRTLVATLACYLNALPGKGVHVVVPLTPNADWPAVKDFASRFAQALAQAEPDRFVATMAKAKRKGRIFIDWLRNQRGSTAVMPYSARSRSGAPVAAPIAWTNWTRPKAASASPSPMPTNW